MDKVVVSFKETFQAGQAYVALSRAKSIDGLFIQNFDIKKIRTSKKVESEMHRLRNTMVFKEPVSPLMLSSNAWAKVCHINVRSLQQHKDDLNTYQKITACDVICVSETWLSKKVDNAVVNLPGFQLFRRDRQDCFKFYKYSAKCLKCDDKGGVALYVKHGVYVSLLDKFCTDGVESLYCMFSKGEVQVYLGVIYRP